MQVLSDDFDIYYLIRKYDWHRGKCRRYRSHRHISWIRPDSIPVINQFSLIQTLLFTHQLVFRATGFHTKNRSTIVFICKAFFDIHKTCNEKQNNVRVSSPCIVHKDLSKCYEHMAHVKGVCNLIKEKLKKMSFYDRDATKCIFLFLARYASILIYRRK